MFSGPGISAFFQPIRAAGAEAVPAQAVRPLRKAGDDPRGGTENFQDKTESPPAPSVTAGHAAADAFTEDHTALSIPALRALLAGGEGTGGAPASRREEGAAGEDAADAATAAEMPPALRAAAAAYQHAAAVKPPAAPPVPDGFTPPPRDQASAADILLMLAQIEAAGMHEIAVRDGSSIYDTLAALCWSLQR